MSEKEYEDQVEGRNSVLELLESGKDINKIFIQIGEKHGSINKIISKAKENRIVIVQAEKSKLDKMSQTNNHQGVIAIVPPFEYSSVEDIVEEAKKRNEQPFILILDGIEDPHNLGAIIRTCEAAGFDNIIIPKNRSVSINGTVVKTSVGTIERVKIAQVTNLNNAIQTLKKKGYWIIGTDMIGTDYKELDYNGKVAIVIGNEGVGISRLVKENCDFIATIPMNGQVNSLNASVAAGVLLFEILRQRR